MSETFLQIWTTALHLCHYLSSVLYMYDLRSACCKKKVAVEGCCAAADGRVRVNVRCMLWREHLQGTGVGGPQAAPQYWLKLRQPRSVAWVCILLSSLIEASALC